MSRQPCHSRLRVRLGGLLALSLMFAAVGPAVASEHVVQGGSGELVGTETEPIGVSDETFVGSPCFFEAETTIFRLQGVGTYHGWDGAGERVIYQAQVGAGETLHEDGPIEVEVENTVNYYHGPEGTHGTVEDLNADECEEVGVPIPAEVRVFAEGHIHREGASDEPCVGHGEFWRAGEGDPDNPDSLDGELGAEWTWSHACTVTDGDGNPGVAPAGSEHDARGVHEPCFEHPCPENTDVDYRQSLATIDVEPGSDTGAIDGTVTDSDTGDAIEGATVTADGESTTTASDGSYELAGLAPGDYTVTADASGYQQASQDVTVEEGATTADFALDPVVDPAVEETGAVAGTVTDSDSGDAIEDATVTADGESTTTASDGSYELAGLAPGDYTVTADASGYQQASQDVTVEEGATTADFALDPAVEETGAVAGTVTDSDSGDAIEGATVTADGESTTTASDGSYELAGLAPSDYTVSADADGYQSASQEATVEAATTTTADFALTVESAPALALTLTGPASAAVGQDVAVTATLADDGDPVEGVAIEFSVEGPGAAQPGSGSETTGAEGEASFAFAGDTEGSYTVTASATHDGEDLSDTHTVELSEPVESAELALDRLSGAGRVETALAVSQEVFDAAGVAVLARADDFPDALTAASLAAEVGGPILITPSGSLHGGVAGELQRLGVEQAYLVGGTEALSAQVADDVAGLGIDVERLDGQTRYHTAEAIAREVAALGGPVTNVVLARDDVFPGALAAGNLATWARAPILLTPRDELHPAAESPMTDAQVVSVPHAYVAGGEAAVGPGVVAGAEGHGYSVQRLSGPERYATAAAIVQEALAVTEAQVSPLFMASGFNFPDALAAGPAAQASGGVLALVDRDDLANSAASRDLLQAQSDVIGSVRIVGGTAAVSDAVTDQIQALFQR